MVLNLIGEVRLASPTGPVLAGLVATLMSSVDSALNLGATAGPNSAYRRQSIAPIVAVIRVLIGFWLNEASANARWAEVRFRPFTNAVALLIQSVVTGSILNECGCCSFVVGNSQQCGCLGNYDQ